MPREPKLQRWTDLIAALLRRNYPATFDELSRDIPAYADESKRKDAVMRMFERDKDELRSFGIDIATSDMSDDGGETKGYRLDRKTFYLPYLSLAAGGGTSGKKANKIDKHWYRALANLVFEPDDLAIIAAAGQRVRQLGDPVLSEDVEAAIRKLSFDLPLPSGEAEGTSMIVAERVPTEDVFEILDDALTRKKRVTFRYHSLSSDQESERTVEPYGLFFLSSHWYLAGRLSDSGEMRNFRLSRIRNVKVNSVRAQSADYEIPATFRLREHARSKQPWELGETDANEAIVDFRGQGGALKAAARLGVSVEGGTDRRKFRIKRQDSFARWLLSFGGGAIPISPPSLVDEFNRHVAATSALYGARP